jgi:hypothetical protein
MRMKNILTSNNISLDLRLRLVKCYIFPVLTYNCETWTLNKDIEKRIEALEMWILRLSVSPTLLTHIQTRKLKYFGHIARHENICKDILEGKVEGKRQHGRQQLMWLDDIKIWTKRTMHECTVEAKNRDRWNVISRQPLKR